MPITPGTVLQQRYEIVQLIGQGAMGAVYEARDQRLRGRVALKHFQIAAQIDAPTEQRLRRAFEHEAQILHTLRHSALPHIIDHFAEPSGQFLVMEFVDGPDLEALLAQRGSPFPVPQVLAWADQLLAALSYLHTRQPPILHRDIKPQNIKLTPEGELILLDFGLAKGAQSTASTMLRSVMAYTPHYAPLEQIQGSGTTERSDLYAAAATLYHLLTGQVPPDALTRATAVLQGQPDPLRPPADLAPLVPPMLNAALMQALDVNPQQRPPSAQAFRDLLRQQMPASVPAPVPSATIPVGPSAGDTVVVGATPSPSNASVDQAFDRAPTIGHYSPPQRRRSWPAYIAGGLLLLSLGLIIPKVLNADRTAGRTGAAVATEALPASALRGQLNFIAPAPTGPKNWIYTMNADGSNIKEFKRSSDTIYHFDWSPDGTQMAVVADIFGFATMYTISADGSNYQSITNRKEVGSVGTTDWSPDGTQFVFSSYHLGRNKIYISSTDGSNLKLLTDDGGSPSWSPNGKYIAFTSGDYEEYDISVMDLEGSESRRLTTSQGSDFSAAWSPDGKYIAFVSERDGNQEIYRMNADGSNQIRLTNHLAEDTDPAWSHDGEFLAFVSKRDGNEEIYLMTHTGEFLTRLTNNTWSDTDPSWKP